jgi:flagellar hook assembly protein FlgD
LSIIHPSFKGKENFSMKHKLLIAVFGVFIISSVFLAEPSFNGNSPGCSGGSCHTFKANAVTLTPLENLQVSVQVNGVSSGKTLAGELVDASNNVVDVINSTTSNPFILTAPEIGTYTVNAGYKSPREYSTGTVEFVTSSINIPTPSNVGNTFQLFPNHPNPFNNETIIKFSVPKGARVEVAVFNIHGKHIRHLSNDYYQAGIHALRWNGRDDDGLPVASGMYLCQIKSGQQRDVRSMILSK